MNLDDNDLFRDAMGDVTPLKDTTTTLWLKAPSTKAPRKPPGESELENFLTRGDLEIVSLNTRWNTKPTAFSRGFWINCAEVSISWMPA
ncbi:Probable DNA endonuclease SmrA [Pantoea agglomerans]|uniref:Probable DNA endonuclease SmrA n=1 Tax=Enterobacter agglomerans TaxID=549 RepID=A0A379AHG5_ENTAG|nr:Probable DNA endonuclease SmrA [Pantoea agglomerans]